MEHAVPVYNPDNLSRLHDSMIAFTISDSLFLETLMLKIRGETIKYSSTINKKKCKKGDDFKNTFVH